MPSTFFLYKRYIGISVHGQMQYRASFLMMSGGQFVVSTVDFLALLVLFTRFESIQGWSMYEVGLLFGIIGSGFALADAIFRGFDAFGKYLWSKPVILTACCFAPAAPYFN